MRIYSSIHVFILFQNLISRLKLKTNSPFSILYFSCSHFATLGGAVQAGFGTFKAMLHVFVFATLSAARIANAGAHQTNFFRAFAAEAHELRGRVTDRRTLHVQLNAARHHFHVFLLRAGGGAVVAKCPATQAGFNARLEVMIPIHKKGLG